MPERGITGADAVLPDTYGLPAKGLAALLEDARERYASERGRSASEREPTGPGVSITT